ncbi:MAG: hypothetical protein BSOLF_0808 [Candidatus Carbobacillus altaicus]|uniref:Uncharacterized protein n=1 Tax=Candidatus Carbonibacillus altaicus TaxID=2163959 RepID=A0A2R6Y0C7_9BACL|nr:MAG: hypothetical protein BSOLF_0808 [Candidatus Carbobacillus altaicus]
MFWPWFKRFKKNDERDRWRDSEHLKTEHSYRHDLLPEEFPEGPYGSPMEMEVAREWSQDDHRVSAFEFESKEFHEGIPRHLPPVDASYGEVPEGIDGQP